MGITGLARWSNSNQQDLDIVCQRIMRTGGVHRGRWLLLMRTYRSTAATSSGTRGERIMHTVTPMGASDPCTYVWLEDGSVPSRGEYRSQLAEKGAEEAARSRMAMLKDEEPAHFRTTFVTLKPPNSLDMLLINLRASWIPGRQIGEREAWNRAWQAAGNAPHLTLDGFIFHIGSDWIVRVGNLSSPAGGAKGMILEAEYLPLVHMPTREDGDVTKLNDFLSSFLAGLFPASPGARRTVAALEENLWVEASAEDIFENLYVVDEAKEKPEVPHVNGVSESQKEKIEAESMEVDKPLETPVEGEKAEGEADAEADKAEKKQVADASDEKPNEDEAMETEQAEEDVELTEDDWVYGTDTVPPPDRLDWVGAEKDRRSAFSIMFVLRRENIL
ncbi:hypothetical protein CALVIDRAFT_599587 [Calocera viscosa TUFC12733]|uniref:Mediator complex subunit 20 n=1 Tax=Calocera viscosa (strain TUFC12733) TaxID=1330018 RepID=A0A167KNS5_CALVF|nr:hypothetical protein CALVIDRAFT_599587 [Calocera viscosa TUFC12733]